jgi:catechol 2,3-dioxygenase-like lactoylglutathione lyase family enzyme
MTTTPIIKVRDIAWVRLRSPDLDAAERFLTDFGLVRSARTDRALYMRGTDPAHHIHITELGEPRVLGIAFHAGSEADLHRLSREAAEGATPVLDLEEPGGGKVVRLTEPNGFPIEVVHGLASLPPLPVRTSVLNTGPERRRLGELQRMEVRPCQVKRIGHAVIATPDIEDSKVWVQRHLGFVTSDDVHAEDDPDLLLASFNRADRGAEFVDHHIMMFARNERRGLNHVSYEVQDVDDLMAGHDHLKAAGDYRHFWGIGRHLLGSQIFDYWADPWGRVHEHWTDSDLLNNRTPPRRLPRSQGLKSQWGPQAPQAFREAASV